MLCNFVRACSNWVALLKAEFNSNPWCIHISSNCLEGFSYPNKKNFLHSTTSNFFTKSLNNDSNRRTNWCEIKELSQKYIFQARVFIGIKNCFTTTNLQDYFDLLNKKTTNPQIVIAPYFGVEASKTTEPCVLIESLIEIKISLLKDYTLDFEVCGCEASAKHLLDKYHNRFSGEADKNNSSAEISVSTLGLEFNFDEPLKRQIGSTLSSIQERMNAGDCYLLNYTTTLRKPVGECDINLEKFITLWSQRISRYGIYCEFDDTKIVSFSPERFIKIANKKIVTEPIKGTYKPTQNRTPSQFDARCLWKNRKEIMEQTLVVDLLRNDLNLVCEPGSVKVYEPFFAGVSSSILQMQSFVEGELKVDGLGNILSKMLPAGSITGTPKQKVCELIKNFEQAERGYYTGIFGVRDSESFDSAILIRSIFFDKTEVRVGVGAGITAQSNIAGEIEEFGIKLNSFLSSPNKASIHCDYTKEFVAINTCKPVQKLLFIDHQDSFANNIIAILAQLGMKVDVINSKDLAGADISGLNFTDYSGIVFSPGPGHPSEYPNSVALIKSAFGNIPILGICLGFQLVLYAFGAKLKNVAKNPLHGQQIDIGSDSKSSLLKDHCFAGKYVLFNSLGVAASDPIFADTNWLSLAQHDSMSLIVENVKARVLLTQFHPESFASKTGIKLFKRMRQHFFS